MRVVVVGIANLQTSLPVGHFPVEYTAQRYLTGRIRHTVGGVGLNGALVLSALGYTVAVARPPGPPPTTTTSYSMASRGPN